jgi:CheY-like chemotaxis protein
VTNGNWPFLVVDDEPEMCWVIEQILMRSGLVCEKALNGREAIALMKRQPFRMAFLDAKLPDFDGLELARRIRKLAPNLPLILVSGYFYQEDVMIQEARESGLISAFISKPFEHIEILRVIEIHALR